MYLERRYIAGQTIEVHDLHSTKYGKKHRRATRENPTPEKIQKHNAKLAKDKLRRKINTNFQKNDFHLIFTYENKALPSSPKEAADIFKKVINKARKEYKKDNNELKYIWITGFIDKDITPEENYSHKETRLHHHLVANYIDIRLWTSIWEKYGRVLFFPLGTGGDYTQLAHYFFRHTENNYKNIKAPTKQRYSCSRNLKEPKVKEKVVTAETWRKDPKPIKGYYIDKDSIEYGVSEITGYPYRFYRMIKIQC